MREHTPGPWFNAGGDNAIWPGCHIRSKAKPGYLAEVRACFDRREVEANARLIAAAPDLLAALIDARKGLAAYVGLPVEQCIGGEFTEINAAIAKAAGESHD